MTSGLSFGFLGDPGGVTSSNYKSADSHQGERMMTTSAVTAGTYYELGTVTTGKTFFVSGIVISTPYTGWLTATIATGAAAAEVDTFQVVADRSYPVIIPLSTPMKFSSATRISCKNNAGTATYFSLIGWEQPT